MNSCAMSFSSFLLESRFESSDRDQVSDSLESREWERKRKLFPFQIKKYNFNPGRFSRFSILQKSFLGLCWGSYTALDGLAILKGLIRLKHIFSKPKIHIHFEEDWGRLKKRLAVDIFLLLSSIVQCLAVLHIFPPSSNFFFSSFIKPNCVTFFSLHKANSQCGKV